MTIYNFDEKIDRTNTNSLSTDGFRGYIFHAGPEKKFPYADDEFIRMWVADMEFATPPEICQAMKDRIDRRIFGYSNVTDPAYYKAFQNWCKTRYNWNVKKEEIAFSPGIIPALYQLIEDLVQPNEKVLTFAPAYGYFAHAAEYNHVELITSNLIKKDGRFSIDFNDLDQKASQAKVLILCNPHNPTGRIWTHEELKAIADIIKKYKLWVISDEIHCDIVRQGNVHIPMAKIMPRYQRLITCMSGSKTFNMAGLQFSNIIIRNQQERIQFQSRDKIAGFINPISIAAHTAAYEKCEDWLNQMKTYLDGNFHYVKQFLDTNLPETNFTIPESTYLAWIDLHQTLPQVDDLPSFFAYKAGVLLEGGDALFVGNAKGYIRLNLAMPREYIQIGLDRMLKAIKENQ